MSFIILILFSLVGYSVGAVGKAGKSVELKPQITDLTAVVIIWAAAVCFRIALDFNKWLLILIWVILSSIIGLFSVSNRKSLGEEALRTMEPEIASKDLLKRLWQNWKNFSKRIGSFQSGIILSMVFFILVSPFALAVKISSDPLRIKHLTNESNWLPKEEIENDLEQFKRQF